MCARAQTKIDSPVADIQWVGKEKKARAPHGASILANTPGGPRLTVTRCLAQTVFVRSTKNFVYRSKDEGKNWEKQNWKMEKAGSEEEGPLRPRPW